MDIFRKDEKFFRCNFHMHTTRSDGVVTPEEALAEYHSAGYDVVAITDHRQVTHVEKSRIPEGLTLYTGIELDYSLANQVVHLLGIDVDDAVMEKWNPRGCVQEGIDLLKKLAGMTVLCHPAWSLNLPETIASMDGIDAVEVWNSVSTLPSTPPRADSTSLLDVTAAHYGWIAPFVANDDTHWYTGEKFLGYTMVQAASPSPKDVLSAIKEGRSYATQGPLIHQITIADGIARVETSPVNAIAFATNNPWDKGRVTTSTTDSLTSMEFSIPANATFLRIQLTDTCGRNAWSNQISVKGL